MTQETSIHKHAASPAGRDGGPAPTGANIYRVAENIFIGATAFLIGSILANASSQISNGQDMSVAEQGVANINTQLESDINTMQTQLNNDLVSTKLSIGTIVSLVVGGVLAVVGLGGALAGAFSAAFSVADDAATAGADAATGGAGVVDDCDEGTIVEGFDPYDADAGTDGAAGGAQAARANAQEALEQDIARVNGTSRLGTFGRTLGTKLTSGWTGKAFGGGISAGAGGSMIAEMFQSNKITEGATTAQTQVQETSTDAQVLSNIANIKSQGISKDNSNIQASQNASQADTTLISVILSDLVQALTVGSAA